LDLSIACKTIDFLLKLEHMKKPELLAPAGNLKKLKFALKYGADAVYCGVPDFSLRVRINQFNMRSLKQGIEYAHKLNKKVYVTVNIFAHEPHLKKLENYVRKLKQLKPDALIVSDPGVIQVIKKIWPKAELHLSTQANCTNSEAVKFWAKQGIKRIILGREVTLAEIKKIHKAVPRVELEYFVHGAMCMSYSGRCLLSKFFTGRSGNLGDCTQPCRWKYTYHESRSTYHESQTAEKQSHIFLSEVKRPEELLEMEEDQNGSYIMNSKDLCLIEYLKELEKAGICSFKIEGRAKSIYYLGTVVNAYSRKLKDESKKSKVKSKKVKEQRLIPNIPTHIPKSLTLKKELMKTQNRGFTTGFLFGKEKCEQLDHKSHEEVEWEFCGEILSTNNELATCPHCYAKRCRRANSTNRLKNKYLIKMKVHNQIFVGDRLEFIIPGEEVFSYKVKKMYNKNMEEIDEAHGGQDEAIYLEMDRDLPEMTLVRRKLKR